MHCIDGPAILLNAALVQLILLLVASSWLVPWYGSQRWLHVL
jgi:hypothetical protein